jgi:AraC-like DNA-binding protein
MRIIDMEVHYPFPPDSLLQRPIYVSIVGYGKGDSYHYARERGGNSLAFEYVVEGNVEATIDSLSYRPGPGDVYLLQPSASFEVHDCGEKWHKLWFVVQGQLMESLLSAYGLSNVHYIAQCPVRPAFERMLRLAASPDADKDTIQDRLITVFYEALLQISAIVTKRGVAIPDDVLRVKNYLDSRIESQVSLLELCELVAKSKAHVIRTFRRAIGVTPYAYFLDRKIAHAKILLAYSSTKVKQVAESLGFSDEYYFSNVFKKKTGLSPSAYRKEKASGNEPLTADTG